MPEHVFRLKLADGVVYAEREGKHLFLQPETPDWMVLNLNGAILLARCTGATIEEILKGAGPSVWEQASELLAEGIARGLLVDLSDSPGTAASRTLKFARHECTQRLSTVHLKLTNQCNLGCNYCYAQADCGLRCCRGANLR